MKKNLLLICTLFITLKSFGGESDWFLVTGRLHLKVGYQYINTSGYYDNDGEVQKLLDYRQGITFLNGQFGISENLNLGFAIPAIVYGAVDFDFEDVGKRTISSSAVGDASLFAKYRVYKNEKSDVVITGTLVLPSGNDKQKYGINSGYGTFGESLKAEYIYKHNEKLYMQAYGGFLNRGNDFTDEVQAGGDIGYRALPHIWTKFLCRAINPLENGDDDKSGGIPGFSANNSGYIRLGLELNFTIGSHVEFFANSQFPVRGQFVQSGPVFEGGLSVFFGGKN